MRRSGFRVDRNGKWAFEEHEGIFTYGIGSASVER